MLNESYDHLTNVSFIMPVVFFLTITNACANKNAFNLESHIGLYELVEKKCDVINDSINPCDTTYFFELVLGKFSGIRGSEMAYVFWSGDPKVDPELQYTAQLIKNHRSLVLSNNKLWLNKDGNSQEYLRFSDGKLDGYFVEYKTDKMEATRSINYTLKPTKRTDHSNLHLYYPERD